MRSDPQAAFSLAMMYWDGIGVDKNALASQKWLIKSANLQNKNALYNLGYLRNKGLIQSPTDDAQGLTSLTKAADLVHHDGLIKIIEELNNSDTLSSKYFRRRCRQ